MLTERRNLVLQCPGIPLNIIGLFISFAWGGNKESKRRISIALPRYSSLTAIHFSRAEINDLKMGGYIILK